MTRQPPVDAPVSPDRTAIQPPAPPPSPAGFVPRRTETFYADRQNLNTATNYGFDGHISDLHWASDMLDVIMAGNSEFSTFREFEIFLYLYTKKFNSMSMNGEERQKLLEQLLTLQKRTGKPDSVLVMSEAQQSVQTGRDYLSLEDFANRSQNGHRILDMVNDCIFIMSIVLEGALEEVATAHTIKEREAHWKELDIKRLKSIVIHYGSKEQFMKLSGAVGYIDMVSAFAGNQAPPHCPDAPNNRHDYTTAGVTSELQVPWSYDECLGYLTRCMVNFMTSPNPESFFFSLPSASKLQGMTADERAEVVRNHLIEKEAEHASGLNGTLMEAQERVAKSTSIQTSSDFLHAALAKSRDNRYRKATGLGYDQRPGRGGHSSWSIHADEGNSESSWGDALNSGWLPGNSDGRSPPKKLTKHVSFDPSTKGTSELLKDQQAYDSRSDTSASSNSESECLTCGDTCASKKSRAEGPYMSGGSGLTDQEQASGHHDYSHNDTAVYSSLESDCLTCGHVSGEMNYRHGYMTNYSRSKDREQFFKARLPDPSWDDSLANAMQAWDAYPESDSDYPASESVSHAPASNTGL